jgi:hypothetical protein
MGRIVIPYYVVRRKKVRDVRLSYSPHLEQFYITAGFINIIDRPDSIFSSSPTVFQFWSETNCNFLRAYASALGDSRRMDYTKQRS